MAQWREINSFTFERDDEEYNRVFDLIQNLEKRRDSLLKCELTEKEKRIVITECLYAVIEIARTFNMKFGMDYINDVPYINKTIKIMFWEFPIPHPNCRCSLKFIPSL